ncbi:MAG: DUF4105 domain-containing protein, partial [Kiritimatiellia bacterium]
MLLTLKRFYAQLRLCVVFFFCGLLPLRAVEPAEISSPLWSQVEARRLWDDPEWWTLVHYHRTMWGRVESRIDDPRFFLHPRGKVNRKAELKATLHAFLEPESVGGERSLACRFPARRQWLLEKLELPESVFPDGDCEDFHEAIAQLEIESAAMIYPAGYLNSPASMFGHLLLVLDRKDKDRLLSRAVNYAAVVGDSFGPLFAVKGIFGLYDGVFAILPYYDKVEEYSAVNRRDIWEYPLELSETELDRLLRHVWELQELRSRYFFFKENCAFNLLYPIEAARASVKLVRRFRMSAVPVSLLQQLAESGATGEPVYRPSKASVMRDLVSRLSPAEQERARVLMEGGALDGSESAVLISFAIEWIQYLYTEKMITPEVYRERIFPLLSARSKLGRVETSVREIPAAPDQGHAPRRLGVYGGVNTTEGDGFWGVTLRAAYHDWLDDPAGYPEGSSIRMFEVDVRGDMDEGEVYLRDFTLVDIRSQTPPELWVRPLSWAVRFSAEADPFDTGHHRMIGRFATGFTERLGANGLGYVMMSQLIRGDSDLDDHLGWEPGGEWGVLHATSRLRAGVRGRHHWGVWGSSDVRHHVEAEIRLP